MVGQQTGNLVVGGHGRRVDVEVVVVVQDDLLAPVAKQIAQQIGIALGGVARVILQFGDGFKATAVLVGYLVCFQFVCVNGIPAFILVAGEIAAISQTVLQGAVPVEAEVDR